MRKTQVNNEVNIHKDYTLDRNSNIVIISDLEDNITITIPDFADNYSYFWKILRVDNSGYRVVISLDNPDTSIINNNFHSIFLNKNGEGIIIYYNELNGYSYSKCDTLVNEESIPYASLVYADLRVNKLVLKGKLERLGTNNSIEIFFRYREQGSLAWTNTATQVLSSLISFDDFAEVLAGVKYEVQIVIIDNKSVYHYSNIYLSTSWIDLRLNGDILSIGNAIGNDIRFRNGMSASRDANGMYFTGSNPFSSWVKIEKLKFQRSSLKTVEWIFTSPNSTMGIGITSNNTNEVNNSQHTQSEFIAYLNGSPDLYYIYGNNGRVGVGVTQPASASLVGYTGVFKLKITNSGSINKGSIYLYVLPNADRENWNNEDTLIYSALNTDINSDEPTIMPSIIPRSGGAQRFIAVAVK